MILEEFLLDKSVMWRVCVCMCVCVVGYTEYILICILVIHNGLELNGS